MNEKEKMHTGDLYLPNDEEIMTDQLQRLDRLYDFNMTRPTELDKREALLREMFAEIGEGCYIEPPFHSNFGGNRATSTIFLSASVKTAGLGQAYSLCPGLTSVIIPSSVREA